MSPQVRTLVNKLVAQRKAGRCSDAQLNGVAEAPLKKAPCKDWLGTIRCEGLMATGITCKKNLCPTCGLSHQCDESCRFCRRHDREPDGGEHRRRAQISMTCPPATLQENVKHANAACCDTAECKKGHPQTCDAKCAVHFAPLYDKCARTLRQVAPDSVQWMDQMQAACTKGLPRAPLLRAAAACSSKAAKCSAPPTKANGMWENAQGSGSAVGSTVSLNCNPGFTEQPAGAALQCRSAPRGAKWVGAGLTATCVAAPTPTPPPPPGPQYCLSPPTVTAGMWMPQLTPGQTTYSNGASVSLMCLQGYTQVPATLVTSLCVNGAFTAASAQCVQSAPPPPPPACLSPPTVGAGMWMPQLTPGQTTYSDGATVTLSCLQGYTQVPATLVTSLCVNGAFTAASAQCVKSGGGVVTGGGCAVPAVSTGPTTGTWMVDPSKMSHAKAITGATASLHCNLGYVPSVGGQLTCTANGLWAGSTTAGCIAGGGR
jgi:hypothetical protein